MHNYYIADICTCIKILYYIALTLVSLEIGKVPYHLSNEELGPVVVKHLKVVQHQLQLRKEH